MNSDWEDEDKAEFTEYAYIPAKFSNQPHETSELMLSTFKTKEIEYGEVLKCLVAESLSEELDKYYIDPDELLGRIDLIERYHRHQFLPEIKATRRASDLVELFFKHKWLFYMYEDAMRREPLLIWLKLDCKNLEIFFENNKSLITQKLEDYVLVLGQLKSVTNANPKRFDIAIKMIVDVCNRGHMNNKRDFVAAEMIYTEMKYIGALEKALKSFEEHVFKLSKRFLTMADALYGMLPTIYQEQKKFLKSLQIYLYDFDIIGIMKCFLEHEKTFELYVEDRKLKRYQKLEECKSTYPAIRNIPDLTLDRLFRYSQFLEKLKKLYKTNEIAHRKLSEVEDLFSRIKNGANDILAIVEIVEPNIPITEQGRFLWRESLKVQSNLPVMSEINRKECFMFLFEKCLIFTKQIPDNKYLYIYHILTTGITYRKPNPSDLIISRGNLRDETFKLMAKEDKFQKLLELEDAIENIMDQQLKKMIHKHNLATAGNSKDIYNKS